MNVSLRAGSITPVACGACAGGRVLRKGFEASISHMADVPACGNSCLSLNSLMSSTARRKGILTPSGPMLRLPASSGRSAGQ